MREFDNSYNNADSFAMLFDEEWKRKGFNNKKDKTLEEKINIIIEENKEHPFIKSSSSEAFQVAKFRLRLLKLE